MATTGKDTNFEKDYRKRARDLEKKLNRHEDNLSRIMFASLTNPKTSNAYWNTVRNQINKEYRAMNKTFSNWSIDEIPARYRRSAREMSLKIESLKDVTNEAKVGVNALLKSNASIQIQASLYQDALNSFVQSSLGGQKNMIRITRMTQQKLIAESTIDAAVAKAIEAGDISILTRVGRSAAPIFNDPILRKLQDALVNQRFVEVNGRKYKPSYYAEMVARVKFHEAHSFAALATAKNYSTDLMIVSSHNTSTAVCQQFEGKIFSISGKDKRFPQLTATPPFHVNCLHLIFPQFESALEVQGTLEEFSEFSRGKTNKPPHPASFEPVEDRQEAA